MDELQEFDRYRASMWIAGWAANAYSRYPEHSQEKASVLDAQLNTGIWWAL